jgi:hypothetical protein
MVVGPSVGWKDGMTESNFLNPFLVRSKQHLDLTLERGGNLDPLFFPSSYYFQVTFLSYGDSRAVARRSGTDNTIENEFVRQT